MQAIRTRYYGATNSRGARIIATAEAGSIVMPYDYALDAELNHRNAAELLMQRFNWQGVYRGGWFDDAYYWVAQSGWMPETRTNDAPSGVAA